MRLTHLLTFVTVAIALLASPAMLQAERKPQSNQIGAQEHPRIQAQFGGAISRGELAQYVARIGAKMARLTPEKADPWTFTVLDTPVVNAFALPGGYVYVTRGLLAIANNEAELAAVLGHEIGHVVSGHGEDRVKQNNRAGIGVIIGTILGGVFGGEDGAADAIELGAKLANGYLAQYSQDQELAADQIGIQLLAKAGYSPFAQADFLKQLAAEEKLALQISGRQYNPNRVDFFASHPSTAKRTKKADKAARRTGITRAQGVLNERAYLAKIEGMIYGDTPKEGFIRGLTFSHPKLRFTFTVPEGFILQNFPNQVDATHKSGAKMILSGDSNWVGPMEDYIQNRWLAAIKREARLSDFHDLRRVKINGLDAAIAFATIQTPDGPRLIQLTAIRFDGTTIRIAALGKKLDGKIRNQMNTASQSFRRLSEAEVGALKPFRLTVIKVQPGDTVRDFSASMPLTGLQEAQFRAMNGYGDGQALRPGDLVKVVE
ncbi:MAG: M48 family metalloprotease [Alphaproteobacteria bacterium]|nr:M48 family metalloprotease [Alphaproteobacteria bacterium]